MAWPWARWPICARRRRSSSISAPTFACANAADYPKWYGHAHENPELARIEFVYGIPELHRDEIRRSRPDLQRRLHGGDEYPRALPPLPGQGGRSFTTSRRRGEDRIVRLGRRAGTRFASSRAQRRHALLQADRAPALGRGHPGAHRRRRRLRRSRSLRPPSKPCEASWPPLTSS